MNIAEAKRIDLVAFMEGLGYKSSYRSNGCVWYLSPFRDEKKASFRINTLRNLWYDYGLSDGGDIILLCKYIYHINSVSEALKVIAQLSTTSTGMHIAKPILRDGIEPPASTFQEIEVRELHNSELLRYITNRGITPDIAKHYCREIHYAIKQNRYYGIAFANIRGGYEVRNKYFKGCIGDKGVSIIKDDADRKNCCVFEGFIDFLSWIVMKGANPHWSGMTEKSDFVVLNSITNRIRVVGFLNRYAKIHCYLDNDKAGQMATSFLSEALPNKVIDCSVKYKGFKDLNEYLISNNTLK